MIALLIMIVMTGMELGRPGDVSDPMEGWELDETINAPGPVYRNRFTGAYRCYDGLPKSVLAFLDRETRCL